MKFSYYVGRDIFGGHLKPVTLKPVSHIFGIFRVFVSTFSAFSALWSLLRPLFFWGERDLPHFPHFRCIGFALLLSEIRPTGFIMTGLRRPAILRKFDGSFAGFPSDPDKKGLKDSGAFFIRKLLRNNSFLFQLRSAEVCHGVTPGAGLETRVNSFLGVALTRLPSGVKIPSFNIPQGF